MSDFNNIPIGLLVPAQIPLDVKVYCPNEATLANLGTNNNKAFSYYEGMIVYCVAEKKRYEWKEALPDLGQGLLTENFVYPNNLQVFNIDYSLKEFNFFLKPETLDLLSLGSGVKIYKGFNVGENRHEFLSASSNSILITTDGAHVFFELPAVFQGTDYYVNNAYTGAQESGTASRPFKNLKRCIDTILNRAYQIIDEEEDYVWVETPNPLINSGVAYNKWDFRNIAIRVLLQSSSNIEENIAINNVIYELVNNSYIRIPNTNTVLERLIDMKELVDNCPKDINNKLTHNLLCSIVGKGRLQNFSTVRKGIARAYGYYGDDINGFENVCQLNLGDINSELYYEIQKLSSLTYVPLYSDDANTIPIVREGVEMTGHLSTETPDYGVIEFDGANAPYRYSLFMDGLHFINAFEQQIFLGKNKSGLYGENGTLYFRRSYQHVNYSTIETIELKKYYKPSNFVYDILVSEGAVFAYAGKFYTQENTGMNQGGSEAFVCVSSEDSSFPSSFNANGGGIIYKLFYNHYFKIINNSSFSIYQTGQINCKNLNIESVPFVNIFEVVDEDNNPKTEVIYPSVINDCYFFDIFERGNIRRDFSNIELNSELFINGNLIKIANTIMLPSVPNYTDNAAALSANMPVSSLYKDDDGFLKIVE